MKKLLGIIVLVLMWCNAGVSGENKFTARDLNINLPGKYELQKIGSTGGTIYSDWWKITFYAQAKEGKLVSLLEIFDTNSGDDWMYNYIKQALFKQDQNSGCNEPNSKYKRYFQVLETSKVIQCVSVKILGYKEEIYGPDIHSIDKIIGFISARKKTVNKFINKNNLEVPDQIIRSEHFLSQRKKRRGGLTWVFLTDLSSDNLTEEQIDNHIVNAIAMHKGFENDLKLQSKYKIDFP